MMKTGEEEGEGKRGRGSHWGGEKKGLGNTFNNMIHLNKKTRNRSRQLTTIKTYMYDK